MSPFTRLLGYAFRYRRNFLLGLGCVVVTTGIAVVVPRILGNAVDDLTHGVTVAKLIGYGTLLLGVSLVSGAFRFLMRRILTGMSREVEYDMRNDFFAHLQTLPASYFQTHRTGDLMSRATNDLNAVRMMIGPAVMYAANTVLSFVIALVLMMAIDARLTLLALIPLPFVSISVKYFGGLVHRRFEQIQAQLSEVSAIAQEALAGVRVVRAYRQEEAEIDRFRRANEEYLRRNRRLIAVQGLFFPCMSLFLGLGGLVVLWAGSREVIAGRITVGQFVAFNGYLTLLSWPLIAFGWVTNMMQRGMASWTRMLEVLETGPAIADVPNLRLKPVATNVDAQSSVAATSVAGPSPVASAASRTFTIRGEIEFRNLTFGYNGSPVVSQISARIEAGQTVALVGPTGSGKSTLISLLARLHDPPPGTLFVDGVDVRDIALASLRGSIGFVQQEPFLFSDTLADNVAFGLDARGPTDERVPRHERILAVSAVARLDKDVADFPRGYDTLVGERGITLSGGQKQRTALARALAIDPRILILDDALSAVDTYTEEEILSRLRGVMRQRTSIVVSHRISTVRDADLILVLEGGRIAERGTHDTLVGRGGLYADLYKKQLLEEELARS